MRWFLFSSLVLLGCRSDKGVTVFNPNPEATITSHQSGAELIEGYTITFMGNVSDANHTAAELTTIWKTGSYILCANTPPLSDGTTMCEATLNPSQTEVILEVKDPENALGSAIIQINVIPSESPEAEIIEPLTAGVYYADKKITFEGRISDGEDNPNLLKAHWESDIDGVLLGVDTIPSNTGVILGHDYLSEGEHALKLHVEDTTGKTGQISTVITVGPPNSAPSCEIIAPTTGTAGPQGDTITFTASVVDVDVAPSILSVEWFSDKDGLLGSSIPNSNGSVNFLYGALSVNSHVISMRVRDEVGAECVADVIYTVGTPPSVSITSPTNSEIYSEGDTITFSANISDNEDPM